MKLDIDAVLKVALKKPLSAKEIAEKLGLKGASSAARVRTLLLKLSKKGKLVKTLREGRRGRPATVYSKA